MTEPSLATPVTASDDAPLPRDLSRPRRPVGDLVGWIAATVALAVALALLVVAVAVVA
uniref:Minor tail protein n=2 Tax=unclassified bacterial viruses TaxID=12333 RepID=A0AAU7J7Q8_9VIRU